MRAPVSGGAPGVKLHEKADIELSVVITSGRVGDELQQVVDDIGKAGLSLRNSASSHARQAHRRARRAPGYVGLIVAGPRDVIEQFPDRPLEDAMAGSRIEAGRSVPELRRSDLAAPAGRVRGSLARHVSIARKRCKVAIAASSRLAPRPPDPAAAIASRVACLELLNHIPTGRDIRPT